MASVHPSRRGLVPQEPPASRSDFLRDGAGFVSREDELKRQLLERRRRDDRGGDRDDDGASRDRERGEEGVRDRRRYDDRDDRRREGRDGRDELGRDNDRRREYDRDRPRDTDRDRDERGSRDGDRDRDEGSGDFNRDREYDRSRGGREYDDRNGDWFRRDAPPHAMPPFPPGPPGSMPPFPPRWNGYPPPGPPGQDYGYGRGGGGFSQGSMNLEQRRQMREANEFSIWPMSPERAYQSDDDKEKSRKRDKSRKKRSSRYSDDSDSEYERRRRRRKEKEREKRERRKRRYSDDTASEDERDRREKKSRERSAKVADDEAGAGEEDMWIEKGDKKGKKVEEVAPVTAQSAHAFVPEYEDDHDVGPQPPVEFQLSRQDQQHAFRDMLPGEGAAMLAFAQSGQRIPRRGEIGLTSDQISNFESSGYVMSGSRHVRMNAVRLRKENQVINAEEKRAILILQREEREKKEGVIISQFKEMMEENMRKQGLNRERQE